MAVIAYVDSDRVSRRALQGARMDDPVSREAPRRLTRVRRALARTPKRNAAHRPHPAPHAHPAPRG